MMSFQTGNLLTSDVEALVNTVNCVGIMGKGIALQMKQAFPEMYKKYSKACENGEIKIGSVFTYHTGLLYNPRYIINLPTKKHWKGKSKIEYVNSGLDALINEIKKLNIKSIAIPPLGCGNGGLDWSEVRPLIEKKLSGLNDTQIIVYLPKGPPPAKEMPINTEKPKMTRARALLIRLLELYKIPGYNLSLMEVQKLAYFLQASGEPLRLNYQKYYYGPYAENLNFVLQILEGHFIRGYGDRSSGNAQISLIPEAVKEAHEYLKDKPDIEESFDKIKCLIEGFESPYGLELLSTIHWLTVTENTAEDNIDNLISKVGQWSKRKKNLMKTDHIKKAYDHMKLCGWMPA